MKYIKYIISVMCLIGITLTTGCASWFKDGETVQWDKVSSACSGLQLATQITIYGVCIKNTDFSPIFKAIGEGLIVLSGNASEKDLAPEQLQAYINQLLQENKWGSLASQINSVMTVIIKEYTTLYDVNKDKLNDNVVLYSKLINAIGTGMITGSNIDNKSASANAKTPEQILDEIDPVLVK